jgi:hypothetical protein
MEDLFGGAYRTVCLEIGLAPNGSAAGRPESAGHFQAWATHARADEDLSRDARMMVPVFYDVQRRRTKIWALLGWVEQPLHVGFTVNPGVSVFNRRGRDVTASTRIEFSAETHPLVYPVTAELYVDRLLNRDEFRAACGEGRTAHDIIASIGAVSAG